MPDPNPTAMPTIANPNDAAISAIAEAYCIQRDPRHTAKAVSDVMKECARRLCEGHGLYGASLECETVSYAMHEFNPLTRQELIAAAAGLIEAICLWDLTHAE